MTSRRRTQWSLLTDEDIEAVAGRVALLALGSLEPHAHLPLGTDYLISATILERVAEECPGTVLLPPLPFGYLHKYSQWPGAIGLRAQVLSELLGGVCAGLDRAGVRQLLVMSGHDENREPAVTALRQANVENGIESVYCDWIELAAPILSDVSESKQEGHASEIQTSVLLHLFPEIAVRLPPPAPEPLPLSIHADDLFAASGHGTRIRAIPVDGRRASTGDPGRATADKGAIIVGYIVRIAAQVVEALHGPATRQPSA